MDKERRAQEKKFEEMRAQVGQVDEMKQANKKMEKELKEAMKNYEIVEVKYKEEQKKRKKLHNEIEDMKGKIRVFA